MSAKNIIPALLNYTLSVAARVVSLGMILVLLIVAFSLAAPYIKVGKDQRYIKSIMAAEQAITRPVRSAVPIRIQGHDMTGWIVLVGSFVLAAWFNAFSHRFQYKAEYHRYTSSVEEMRQRKHVSDFAVKASSLGENLDRLKSATKKDREQILREFAETKRKLDEMGRDLAFLAIDIVDSTGMKEDEDKAVVQHDFLQYRDFVSQLLNDQRCLKSTWTPDGVMSCFSTVDEAVRAGTAVITGLETFNRDIKQMKRDFVVRCGVNAGFVIFDESMPLEMITDRAIDIAGHMQKYAAPNTVCIAKPAIEPLNERRGFSPSGKVVDGYEVYEWKQDMGAAKAG